MVLLGSLRDLGSASLFWQGIAQDARKLHITNTKKVVRTFLGLFFLRLRTIMQYIKRSLEGDFM